MENLYKDIVIDNNENIIFKKENLNFEIYENNFFNCFFRTVSKYIYRSENNYAILRKAAYNYVKDNLTEFYEFCYVEDGCYFTDIEEGGVINPLASPSAGAPALKYGDVNTVTPSPGEVKGLKNVF